MRHHFFLFMFAAASCTPRVAPAPPAAATAAERVAAIRLERLAPVREGSSVVLARAGTRTLAFVTDGARVHAVDVDDATEIASAPAPGATSALLLADGRLAVAARDEVRVFALGADDALRADATWPTGPEPSALALTPNEATLLVTTARAIEAHDVATGARARAFDLADAPSAVVVDADGRHALVAHAAASALTLLDLDTGLVRATDLDATGQDVEPAGQQILEEDEGQKRWMFANGMMTMHLATARAQTRVRARHARAFGPADGFAYVAHELVVPTAPAGAEAIAEERARGAYGGSGALSSSEYLGVSIVERASGKRVSFHRADSACRLPRGVAFDASHKELVVACAGTSALVRLAWTPNVEYAGGALLRTTPSFHEVASTVLPAPADGVALDLDHDRAIVSTLLEPGVAIVGRATPAAPRIVRFDAPRDDPASRGARLFVRTGDPRIAEDGRACATCHVDGLSDGLVWNTPRGPRRTPILAGRVGRDGPFGWNGESRDLTSHVATTIHKNLAGKGLASGDLADLTAYLVSLPAPRRGAATRGEQLFTSAGCSGCHVRGGTDGERHDVGSGGAFVTPSLVGLGRTRAFFHDGRYKSLDVLLAKTGGAMGPAIPAADRDALVEYLTSL